jgi:hypothetical protein
MKHVLIGLALAAVAGSAAAQAPTIATDRPDFVESSQTVGAHRFQFETSVSSDVTRGAGLRTTVWGSPTLLRYGVSERVEVRIETDGLQEQTSTGPGFRTTSTGLADAALGIKWHVQDGVEHSLSPSVALLIHADLPSGSTEFRGRGVRPSIRPVAEWELPWDMSLGVMPGVIYDEVGKAWTETFRTFVEFSAQEIKPRAHGENVITYDVGAAYLLRRNWQLDAAVSFGSGAAANVSYTVGLSAVLP